MNRSTRQTVKQPKLNPSRSSNSSLSSASPSMELLGISAGHSLILPKPPLNEEYYTDQPGYSMNNVNAVNMSASSGYQNGELLILPEPIPPLPKTYNTRKRSNEALSEPVTFNDQSSMNDVERKNKFNFPTQAHAQAQPQSQAAPSKPVTIPGFVSKLYRMVDESTSNLIKWGPDGRSFVVTRPEDFSRQVLPLFFKHNNFSSFVRQLNMYGFHKVPHLQQGTMAASSVGTNISTIWEFSNVNFIRNRPELLLNVRRKIGKDEDGTGSGSASGFSSATTTSPALSSVSEASRLSGTSDELISTARTLRQELQFIHQQQNALRTDLVSLQRDNQLLWNENLASRERHLQQQQVIDRILRFLASVFTADGKLLSSNANAFSALQANLSGASGTGSVLGTSVTGAANPRQRPLLLGNISGNEDELRRQVLELISGNLNNNENVNETVNSGKIDLVQNDTEDFLTNFNNHADLNSPIERIKDLESTAQGISNDISLVDDEISNVLKTAKVDEDQANTNSFDDVDFSSYLNCQSLD